MSNFVENIDGSVTCITKNVKSQDDFTLDSLDSYVKSLEDIMEVLNYEI